MLDISKSIIINAYSNHDGKTVVSYSATIDSNNPEAMTPSNYIQDAALYKEHREECGTERTEFENFVFAEQEKVIAEKKAADEKKAQEESSHQDTP